MYSSVRYFIALKKQIRDRNTGEKNTFTVTVTKPVTVTIVTVRAKTCLF